jgi:hypothetical protein
MALVKKIIYMTMDRNVVHDEVDSTYTIFIGKDDKKYLQIDTYGSPNRKLKGKKSQSIQFNEEAYKQLRHIIDKI